MSAGWAERAASLRGLAVLAVPAALLGCVDVTKKDPDVCVGYTCAAGTECTVVHDPAPGNSSLTCELEPTIALSALSEGFAVSPLYLTPQPAADGAKIFTWDIPSGALSVQCTLFGCTPLFAYDRPSADQEPRAYIANFARCQLASTVFATASGPLRLRELTPAAGSSGPALNTALEVGCWAFDGVQVIAASQLFPVDPGDLAAGAFPIVAACTAGADGKSCQLAEPSGFRTFGTCVGGECRHRCFESTDCQRAQLREQQRAAQVADASADAEAPDGGTADASTTGGHCSSADMTRTVVGTCEGP